jgi:hypothetical protein
MLQAGRVGPWVTRKVGSLLAPFIHLLNIVIALGRVLGGAHPPQNTLFWEAISATQMLGGKQLERRRQKAKQPAARVIVVIDTYRYRPYRPSWAPRKKK